MAITPKTYPNILKFGLQASYNSLAVKDPNVLYFCTDSKKIYKGTIDFTDSVVVSTKAADVTAPLVGKLYVFAETGTTEIYTGSEWKVVSYPVSTTIDAASDNVHVPTAKAVYDFVESEIAELAGGAEVVKSIASTNGTEGSITYTTGDDQTHDVALKGVVTTPAYDATTRKFTFPVVGGSDVVVELGKDVFVDPAGNNRYENGNIYIYLNDGTGEKEATELVIPVTGLIKDYVGGDTDSVELTVNNDTHVVTADVVLREDSVAPGEEFTNALKLSTAEGKKGLYVDLSAVEAKIKAAEDRLDAAEAAITKLNGDAAVDGSVAAQIKAESDALKAGVIKTAQDTADKAVADAAAAQAKADQNEADIAALATATTVWGTF